MTAAWHRAWEPCNWYVSVTLPTYRLAMKAFRSWSEWPPIEAVKSDVSVVGPKLTKQCVIRSPTSTKFRVLNKILAVLAV